MTVAGNWQKWYWDRGSVTLKSSWHAGTQDQTLAACPVTCLSGRVAHHKILWA